MRKLPHTSLVMLNYAVEYCDAGDTWCGICSKSVQSRAEVYVLKACNTCADMGQL